jgi:hypothetical protein
MNSHAITASAVLLLSGCYTTRVDVRPAQAPPARPNILVIEKSRAEVWTKAIPALAKRFFVINNIDQSSGLMNVSYSGDPQRYVVGPVLTYTVRAPGAGEGRGVKDDAGAQEDQPGLAHAPQAPWGVASFPGAQARVEYMVAEGNLAAVVTRRMVLEGRANVVLEAIAPGRTLVTVNVRYVLTQSRSWRAIGNFVPPAPDTQTISFNTGGRAAFGENEDALYYPTGALEAELLAVFE